MSVNHEAPLCPLGQSSCKYPVAHEAVLALWNCGNCGTAVAPPLAPWAVVVHCVPCATPFLYREIGENWRPRHRLGQSAVVPSWVTNARPGKEAAKGGRGPPYRPRTPLDPATERMVILPRTRQSVADLSRCAEGPFPMSKANAALLPDSPCRLVSRVLNALLDVLEGMALALFPCRDGRGP